jgi:hypothetical protein
MKAKTSGRSTNWMRKAGADKPGEAQGVLAIIRPEGGVR